MLQAKGSMLRLTTFGGLGLRWDGPDPANSAACDQGLPRRGLALLALLAAGPERGVSRDSIVAYMWPESDEERARNALRQTLFTLRRELGLPGLVSGAASLTLDSGTLTSDLRDFEVARTAGDLERVVRLHAGPFLDGFHLGGTPEFERWVDRQRAEYAARAAGALESLARQASECGDPAAAAEWWRRLAGSDPLNTHYVLELITAQAATGNAAGALRQAQAHEALVREELGAAPNRALTELVARIRNGQPIAAPRSESKPATAQPARPAAVSERFRDRLERELADRYILEQEADTVTEGSVRLLRARDRRHDRPVTLKVIHPSLASQIDVERFIREIRLTGRLLHPHILPLLDSGEVGGRPWYTMPRPEGETLRARLNHERVIPIEEALRLTVELADALDHAHAHGIVHRDVSPENVLLSGGHALLTNLGVARALDSAAGAALTDTGMLVGTPAYMSPEQAEGSRTVDPRSDVYSLAAVLFEMLTGEPLFSGPTPQAIMAKRGAEPTPAEARLAGIHPELRPVLRKALERRAEDRFSSMAVFGSALRDPVAGPPPRRSWRAWLGLSVAIVFLAG
ncbi:MAG: protein kinase domain-containing protein [Gemmatimonadales bacterium]